MKDWGGGSTGQNGGAGGYGSVGANDSSGRNGGRSGCVNGGDIFMPILEKNGLTLYDHNLETT